MSQVSERYASALLALFQEEDKLIVAKNDAETALAAIDEDLLSFLRNIRITKEEKKSLLKECFKALDPYFTYLFCLLVDARRSDYLPEILVDFVQKANQELGIIEVEVTTAHPLAEEEKKALATAIAARYHQKCILKENVNTKLLAGIELKIGQRVIDTSLKYRIGELRRILLKEVG